MANRQECFLVCCVAAMLVLVCCSQPIQAAPPEGEHAVVRMTGAAYRANQADLALTDLLLDDLSHEKGVQVLSRDQLHIVLGERALATAVDDSDRQGKLGRLLGVDVFAWVRLESDSAVLEVVEAATGRGLAAFREAVDPKDPQAAIELLAGKAAEVARQGPSKVDESIPTLAIADPVLGAATQDLRETVHRAMLGLAQELKDHGVGMLSREFSKDLTLERWMADKELTDSQRKQLPMLGARYILTCQLSADGKRLTLSILETATGRRMGQESWTIEETRAQQGRAAISQWTTRRIAMPARADVPTTKPAADLPVQPEVVQPFYEGILLHNQGAYLDAAIQFDKAARRDNRMLQPLVWTQDCLLLAGFDEVAESFGQGVKESRKNWSNILHNPRLLFPGHGVAVLGATADESMPAQMKPTVMMRLIDAVRDATGEPAFVSADLAELRDEYDVLVGLDNVVGTTWRKAPPLVFTQTLTAHLERSGKNPVLRLCLTHSLDPQDISEAKVELGADPATWQGKMAAACRLLMSPTAQPHPAWQHPALKLLPDATPLKSDQNFDVLVLLKHIARTGQGVEYLQFPYHTDPLVNTIMPGLHRWFLRKLSDDDPRKPILDFAYVSWYTPRQDRPSAMATLQQKYPNSGVAVLGELYSLLMTSTRENLPQTQVHLEELLTRLRPFVPGMLSEGDYQRYVDTNLLMRRALGMDAREGKLQPAGQLYVGFDRGTPAHIENAGPYAATLEYPDKVSDAKAWAMVDLEVQQCAWQGCGIIPAQLAKDIFDRHADNPEVLSCFTVTYAAHLFQVLPKNSEEAARILAALWPIHARTAVELLKRDPLPFDVQGVYALVQVDSSIVEAGRKSPAFQEARAAVRQAFVEAIEKGRFGKLLYGEVFELLMGISNGDYEEMLPLLKDMADKSLRNDPLEDGYWRIYAYWPGETLARKMAVYLPAYQRVRELHPTPELQYHTQWQYFGFGLVLFRGEKYDLAEEALSLVLASHVKRSDEALFKANAYYLLALIRQRQGNAPEALRLAQKCADAATEIQGLATLIESNDDGNMAGAGDLKVRANDLIARLRQDPGAPFKDPFERSKVTGLYILSDAAPEGGWTCMDLLDDQTRASLKRTESFFVRNFRAPSDEYQVASAADRARLEDQWLGDLGSADQSRAASGAANLALAKVARGAGAIESAIAGGLGTGRVRWLGTRALGQIGSKTSIPVLIGLLDNQNPETRLYARVSLAEITGVYLGEDKAKWQNWAKGQPSVASLLATEDSDGPPPSAGAWTCMNLLDDQTRASLANKEEFFADQFHAPSEYRSASAADRARLENQWLQDLGSDDEDKAAAAAANLGMAKVARAADAIEKVIAGGHGGGRIRWVGTRSLGQIGGKTSIPVLIGLLDNKNQETRLYAKVSLAQITGVYFGADKSKWESWAKGRPSAASRPLASAAPAAASQSTGSVEALRRLEEAIDKDYSYRDLRKVDWPKLFQQFRPSLERASTPQEFGQIAAKVLVNAKDMHLWVKIGGESIPVFGRDVHRNYNLDFLKRTVPGWTDLSPFVSFAHPAKDVGYILIRGWDKDEARVLAPALKALGDLSSCRGIIVDVRPNGGGAEPLAQKFAGCFIDQPALYSRHQYRQREAPDGWSPMQDRMLTPNPEGPKYRGKVVVLMGAVNMSSCDSFLLMMKQIPNCKLIGEKSYGSSGNPKPHDLGNGVVVWLPSWKDFMPDGTCLEGVGVQPEVMVDSTTADLSQGDPTLEVAMKYLSMP